MAEFDHSSQILIRALNEFSDEHWNSKPADDAWSAAQVAHHLSVIETGVNRCLNGETEPSPRSGDAIIKRIDLFLGNHKRTYSAPDFTLPPVNPGNKKKVVLSIEETRKKLAEYIIKSDLNVLCLEFKHFFFGELTAYEWIHFVMYHSNRHLIQLQSIKYAL